jgi:tripartite-type tricarboxylate transporter receptor subunit TctC
MKKRLFLVVITMLWVVLDHSPAFAAGFFYEGKTIRIVVGFSAGGGFDVYARLLSRHMGKHIPGNPTIIVENMTGAGSLISANYLYRVAKPDGLTIGHFVGNLFISQLLEQQGIEFDARKFKYIGALAKENAVCILNKKSGITSVDKWKASGKVLKLGGLGPNSILDQVIRVLKATTGLPIQLVSGYKGTADVRLAIESGELDGSCWGWDSISTTFQKALSTGDIVPVLQAVPRPLPDLPHLPLAISLAKTDEERQLIEVGIHSNGNFSRPLVLPPGTTKEQEQILRKALEETLKDNEFLAEAGKSQLNLEPMSGDELEKTVNGIFGRDRVLLAKLKEVLFK